MIWSFEFKIKMLYGPVELKFKPHKSIYMASVISKKKNPFNPWQLKNRCCQKQLLHSLIFYSSHFQGLYMMENFRKLRCVCSLLHFTSRKTYLVVQKGKGRILKFAGIFFVKHNPWKLCGVKHTETETRLYNVDVL